MNAILSSGRASATKSSTPASRAIVAAVRRLSPVIITVRTPIRRNSANRAARPGLTVSLSSIRPIGRSSARSASGVAPRAGDRVRLRQRARPADLRGARRAIASTAPLRTTLPPSRRRRWCACRRGSRAARRCRASSDRTRSSSPSPPGQAQLGEPSAGERHDRAALRCLVAKRRQQRELERLGFPDARAPGAIDEASRLPNVIVPVLSSRMTSTSPAASTARPLIASTLNRATRSMPAMPIADSRPPMVVGMRHTRSATSATTPTVGARVGRERPQRDGREQEHEREPGEQDREGELVGRLLALRALDEPDHPVQEGLARVGRDADDELVRHHGRAAGHARADVGARAP